MDITELIECKRCKVSKPPKEFSVRTDNGKRRHVCNICRRDQENKWKIENSAKHKETQRIYNSLPKRKEQRRAYKKYMREHKYNLYLWRLVKDRAHKNNTPFTIEPSDIIIPEICPVLGIKVHPCGRQLNDCSPTLDRINNNLGYIKGNVAVISNRANRIKNDGNAEEHEQIANYIKNKLDHPPIIC